MKQGTTTVLEQTSLVLGGKATTALELCGTLEPKCPQGHVRVHSVTAGDLRRRLDPPGFTA